MLQTYEDKFNDKKKLKDNFLTRYRYDSKFQQMVPTSEELIKDKGDDLDLYYDTEEVDELFEDLISSIQVLRNTLAKRAGV